MAGPERDKVGARPGAVSRVWSSSLGRRMGGSDQIYRLREGHKSWDQKLPNRPKQKKRLGLAWQSTTPTFYVEGRKAGWGRMQGRRIPNAKRAETTCTKGGKVEGTWGNAGICGRGRGAGQPGAYPSPAQTWTGRGWAENVSGARKQKKGGPEGEWGRSEKDGKKTTEKKVRLTRPYGHT